MAFSDFEDMAEIDATLEAAFRGITAPSSVAAAARARITRERLFPAPSALPEVLDFIGWAAVLAAAAILVPHFASLIS